jgi:hypothetical protein
VADSFVFVFVRMLGSVLVVMVLVVGLVSLVVVSLLEVLQLVLNTVVGGVVALSLRGGMVRDLPFVVFLQLDRGCSLVAVPVVVFMVVA